MNPLLLKNYVAAAALKAHRIVKPGADDGDVLPAASAGDALIGVNDAIAVESGERCDIVRQGIANVEFGGAVNRGALLTADDQGRAIAAVVTPGVLVRLIGIADVAAVVDDIGTMLIAPGVLSG